MILALLILSLAVSIAVYWRLSLFDADKNLGVVLPVNSRQDIEDLMRKTWPKCRVKKRTNAYVLMSSNARLDTKPFMHLLTSTGCFNHVETVIISIKPQHDHHPLGASLMFFGALASPSIMLNNAWMMWIESDVHWCSQPWLGALLRMVKSQNNWWMMGGIMRSHSDPLAPFYSFAEHINGNALYNLRDDAFMTFMEQVQEEFMVNGTDRFRDSFDIAIYQVARHTDGFWAWSRIKHRFVYSNYILNHYNVPYKLDEACQEPGVLFVHGKLLIA